MGQPGEYTISRVDAIVDPSSVLRTSLHHCNEIDILILDWKYLQGILYVLISCSWDDSKDQHLCNRIIDDDDDDNYGDTLQTLAAHLEELRKLKLWHEVLDESLLDKFHRHEDTSVWIEWRCWLSRRISLGWMPKIGEFDVSVWRVYNFSCRCECWPIISSPNVEWWWW